MKNFHDMKRNRSLWLCECKCGNETIVSVTHLNDGKTQSCGCLMIERIKAANISHGKSSSVEYRAWGKMLHRCNNPNNPTYKNYGGRDIRVCDRWLESFENFYGDMGDRPTDKHVLGRVDTNGNYEPSNCRWVTSKEQNNKRRNTKRLTINEQCKTLKEWSEISGIEYGTIKMRIRRGWNHREAVFGKNNKSINN